MNLNRLPILLLMVLFPLVACQREDTGEPGVVYDKTYQTAGRIISVLQEDSVIIVKHDKIPGFMAAMTMGLRIKDLSLLSGISGGDSIRFTLAIHEGEMFISDLKKIVQSDL